VFKIYCVQQKKETYRYGTNIRVMAMNRPKIRTRANQKKKKKNRVSHAN